MIAQLKQDLYNKSFSVQNLSKIDENDTLRNRIIFWPNIISSAQVPVPDNIHSYEYNDEALNHSVRGPEIFPEIGDLKKLLGIL